MHYDPSVLHEKTFDPKESPSATLSQQPVCIKAILILLKVVRSHISILPVLDCVVHLGDSIQVNRSSL